MQQGGGGGRQDAHGTQHDQGAVEAHDKAVVRLRALCRPLAMLFKITSSAQAVGGNRDIRNFPGNGRAPS